VVGVISGVRVVCGARFDRIDDGAQLEPFGFGELVIHLVQLLLVK
jgi:hypothetical protein